MAAYIQVANSDDLQPGQAKLVEAGDQRVASSTLTGPEPERRLRHAGGSLRAHP